MSRQLTAMLPDKLRCNGPATLHKTGLQIMFEAARAKAHRGELRISVPVGYIWHREVGLGFDPDVRLQEAVHLIFERFRKLGSARQVLLSLAAEGVHFPLS